VEYQFIKSMFSHKLDTCCFMVCSVQVKELQNPNDVFDTILGLIVRLAEHGLIHCDFNEFNIMVVLSFLLPVCVDL
jgi:RIO-like serine/threonine protein kinase